MTAYLKAHILKRHKEKLGHAVWSLKAYCATRKIFLEYPLCRNWPVGGSSIEVNDQTNEVHYLTQMNARPAHRWAICAKGFHPMSASPSNPYPGSWVCILTLPFVIYGRGRIDGLDYTSVGRSREYYQQACFRLQCNADLNCAAILTEITKGVLKGGWTELGTATDNVLVNRKALFHNRILGGEGKPLNRRPDSSNSPELHNARQFSERLSKPRRPCALPKPRLGVFGDCEPRTSEHAPTPARQHTPPAPALLWHATPWTAQFLPVGLTEQIFWPPVSRYVHLTPTDTRYAFGSTKLWCHFCYDGSNA